MATLAALKKQIAALEAKVKKATEAEMGTALAKVRKIMSDFGLTIEHLADGSGTARTLAKNGGALKQAATKTLKDPVRKAKGSKAPKYQDPATGITWAGVGRAPKWIANVKNREDFLIIKPAAVDESTQAASYTKNSTKLTAPIERAKLVPVAKKANRKAAVKKSASRRAAPTVVTKRASAKKVSAKTAVGKATRKRAIQSNQAALGAAAEAA